MQDDGRVAILARTYLWNTPGGAPIGEGSSSPSSVSPLRGMLVRTANISVLRRNGGGIGWRYSNETTILKSLPPRPLGPTPTTRVTTGYPLPTAPAPENRPPRSRNGRSRFVRSSCRSLAPSARTTNTREHDQTISSKELDPEDIDASPSTSGSANNATATRSRTPPTRRTGPSATPRPPPSTARSSARGRANAAGAAARPIRRRAASRPSAMCGRARRARGARRRRKPNRMPASQRLDRRANERRRPEQRAADGRCRRRVAREGSRAPRRPRADARLEGS